MKVPNIENNNIQSKFLKKIAFFTFNADENIIGGKRIVMKIGSKASLTTSCIDFSLTRLSNNPENKPSIVVIIEFEKNFKNLYLFLLWFINFMTILFSSTKKMTIIKEIEI